jgi:hypothetical protein
MFQNEAHLRLSFLGLLAAVVLLGCPGAPSVVEPPPPAPEIVDFRASAATVETGGPVTLSWETKNATSVELQDPSRGAISGADALSGTVDVAVTEDTLFVLVAKNDRNLRTSAVVAVRTQQGAREVLFFAAPALVDAGLAATLAWSAPGARAVSLRVVGGAAVDLGGQLQSGSVSVAPEQDTTYELVVDGAAYTATVKTRPVIELFAAEPGAVTAGEPVTLKWKTRGATAVTVQHLGHSAVHSTNVPAEVADGEVQVEVPTPLDPAAAFTWRLTAVGSAPEAVATIDLTAYVAGTPRFVSSSAPEYGRLGDDFALSWATEEADRVRVLVNGAAVYETSSPAQAKAHSLQFSIPAQATPFTLLAINDRGGVATRIHTVAPVGVTTLDSFTASPAQLAQGGAPVTLSWNVTSARKLRIVANGQYTVFSNSGPAAETGTLTVYPNGPTTYELLADNTLGDVASGTQAVAVDSPATLTASPSGLVAVNTPLDLSWTVGGAGAEVYGLPHAAVDTRQPSAGFSDISTSGNKLAFAANANDAVLSFDPLFETYLWGQRAPGRVMVSTNGFLVFGNAAQSRPTSAALPSSTVEKNLVAPLWADLELKAGSGIYWEVTGEAPERELVVQWHKLAVRSQPGTEVTFQARIHQTGVVHFEYQKLALSTANPVVGFQGPANAQGRQLSPSLQDGLGLTFFGPRAAPATYAAVSSDPMGGWVKVGGAYLLVQFSPEVILPGALRVTEVMYRPAAAIATTGEWIELFNTTSAAFDLAGFDLDFGGGQVHTLTSANGSTVVPPNGFLLLGQPADPGANDGLAMGYVYGPTFAMDDTSGTVSLVKGSAVASLSWNSSAGGEGVAAQSDLSPALYASGAGAICSATVPFGTQSPQQLGTPGASGSCYPYGMSSIPGSFENLATTGTVLLGSASAYDGIGTFPLPAPFPYFGVTYNSFNLSMCGFLTFGPALTAAYDRKGDALPSSSAPNGVAAIFWDQIVRNSGGNIYTQRMSNYTIVSWQNFRIYGQFSTSLSFQIKLFDNGTIEYHYGTMDPGTSPPDRTRGSAATVWIEKEDGASALPYSIHQVNGVLPNTGVRFSPL